MKFELFVARRYLTRGKNNAFLSVISAASVAGVAIGVASLIIALALLEGFQRDIRNKILNSTAHIMVNSPVGRGLYDYKKIEEKIRSFSARRAESVSSVVFGYVLLRVSSTNIAPSVLRGVDFCSSSEKIWAESLVSGKIPLNRNEVLIGEDLSVKTGLLAGDTCTLVSPQPVLGPSGYLPKMKKFRVSGVFKTGLYEMDSGTLLTSRESAQSMFNMKGKVSYLQIFLKDMFEADNYAESLRSFINRNIQQPLSIITWKDLNADLYSALELEKKVLFFTLSLIIVVASLNIIAGLMLLVMQKLKDIGILLSYGAKSSTITKIFFFQGGMIGLIGTALGAVTGTAFVWFANHYKLIQIPSKIYHMSYVPFRIVWSDFFLVISVSLLICLGATLIPAIKASFINVVDAVKNE